MSRFARHNTPTLNALWQRVQLFCAAEEPTLCEARSVGLVRYPTTLAPVSGSVTVTAKCADNAHIVAGSSLSITCVSFGSWFGAVPECECDSGYQQVTVNGEQICRGQ